MSEPTQDKPASPAELLERLLRVSPDLCFFSASKPRGARQRLRQGPSRCAAATRLAEPPVAACT